MVTSMGMYTERGGACFSRPRGRALWSAALRTFSTLSKIWHALKDGHFKVFALKDEIARLLSCDSGPFVLKVEIIRGKGAPWSASSALALRGLR